MANPYEPKDVNAVLRGGPFNDEKISMTPGVDVVRQDVGGVRHRYVETGETAGEQALAVLLYAGVAEK